MGYMEEDPGYQRFFAYISLFTFAMLMLVMSNNFLQLFFGWEAVGLVSYLLIGFWYTRPTAIFANLKAFLVNRVGDFGFALGIGLLLHATGSLDYVEVFERLPALAASTIEVIPGQAWGLLTLAAILVFVGAMGKSAQFPLHVWLPDSMEGPTPISALIHAATMVTAGIFMVARMSPLFELSDTALSVVIVIGAITSLSMGLMGLVQYDIKRVVAYSTLSQLGLMTIALGASAYQAAIFHLMTHAFFKALLFLAAGSVIIGMHHNQDIRWMGGVRRYMPITWITSLVGSLALIGTPFLSGFYSKDSIIVAVGEAQVAGAAFASFAVIAGVFITAFYSFRMYFLVFHGEERHHLKPADDHGHDDHGHEHGHDTKPHESPWVVTLPLVALAVPSVVIGWIALEPMVLGQFFDGAIHVDPVHGAMAYLREHLHDPLSMALHGFVTAPFWLALAGVVLAWYLYVHRPDLPGRIAGRLSAAYSALAAKYWIDELYAFVFRDGSRALGRLLWRVGDVRLIDGLMVNGSAWLVGQAARLSRRLQSGYLYTYAFTMLIGVLGLLVLWIVRSRAGL